MSMRSQRQQINIRKFLFLSVGLTRVYPPNERKKINDFTEKLRESAESKSYRRRILALSGVVFLTGLSGAEPNNLSVFGIEPIEGRMPVILIALVAIQLYWYYLKYHHLIEDGEIEPNNHLRSRGDKYEKITVTHIPLVRKEADLISNYVAFILTISSWYFVISWIVISPS